MLAYLLLSFYIFNFKRAFIYNGLASLITFGILLSADYLIPTNYDQFIAALNYQIAEQADSGYAVFGLLRGHLSNKWALVVHVAIMALSTFLILIKIPSLLRFGTKSHMTVLLAVILVILINPRMKQYDFFIAVIFTYMFLYLYLSKRALIVMFAGLLVSAAPFLAKVAQNMGASLPKILNYLIINYLYHFQISGMLIILLTVLVNVVFVKAVGESEGAGGGQRAREG